MDTIECYSYYYILFFWINSNTLHVYSHWAKVYCFAAERYCIAESALIVARVKYSAFTRINMQMQVRI